MHCVSYICFFPVNVYEICFAVPSHDYQYFVRFGNGRISMVAQY